MKLKTILLGSSVIMSYASYIEAAPLADIKCVNSCYAGSGYSRVASGSCVKVSGSLGIAGKYKRLDNNQSLKNPDITGSFDLNTKTDMPSGIPLLGSMKFALSVSNPTGDFADLQLPFLDSAYIRYHGVKLGYYTPWDIKPYPGVNLDNDKNKNKNMYSASYQHVFKRVKLGISADVLQVLKESTDTHKCGIGYMISTIFGNNNFTITGGYDIERENAVIRGVFSSKIGSNVLDIIGMFTGGESIYSNQSKYSVAAAYKFNATSKLEVNPAVQYSWDNGNAYTFRFGTKVSYEISKALSVSAVGTLSKDEKEDIKPTVSISLKHSF